MLDRRLLLAAWCVALASAIVAAVGSPCLAEDDWLTLPDPAPSGGYSQPTHLLHYEPQNQPLPSDRPGPFDIGFDDGFSEPGPAWPESALPESAGPMSEPPWIAPYGTQLLVSWSSGRGDSLGMTDIDLRQTLVFPKRPGFIVTPGSSVHFLTGPSSTDLPETLYDHWIEFRWLKKFNDRWAMDLAVAPSLFTDYENTSSDAFRMTGRALALWTKSPEWQFAMGVVYLDREDVRALPGVGAIWTPNDDYKVEVLFPRPRVMKKLAQRGDKTRWGYLAGEFGGGSWAINRTNGTPDVFTYSALRLMVGYETQSPKGFNTRLEAGYIFNRSVEYKSGIGNYDPADAAMLRIGGSF